MANSIIVKSQSSVTAVGPGGVGEVISVDGGSKICQIILINDGADPINYAFNVSGAVPVFAADAWTLKVGESVTHIENGLTNFFMICDTAETATVRYVVSELYQTNRNVAV